MDVRPNVLITGSPGVGKTTLARLLWDRLNECFPGEFEYVNVGNLVNTEKLYKQWNSEFDVPEFDDDLVCDALETKINRGGTIVDFHSADFFPRDWFQLVVVLRTNNTQLYDRLVERGYSQQKITENITCEIFNEVRDEVFESYPREIIMELRSDDASQVEQNLEIILTRLNL